MQATPWDPEGVEPLLDGEGRLIDPAAARDLDLRSLYKVLVHARALDVRLSRLGLPMWVSSAGEEAAAVLAGHLSQADDWLYPGPRDAAAALARGVPVAEIAKQALGDPSAETRGRIAPGPVVCAAQHVAAPCETLGMAVALACGQAHGQKLAGRGITIVLCGEGTSTTGAFHESLAIAALNELPLVIVCRTQPWPGGAPPEAGQLGNSLSERVAGYGVWARRCDGADVLSTHRVLSMAFERARRGEGPAVVEAFVTPLSPQVPAHRDPLERLRRHLDREGAWTQTFQDVVEAEFRGHFDTAVRQFEARQGAAS
jgi:TPP-dependent pyruvate/acetoin dehydrogenase alpha subunit